jgi:hypothetical protein
LKQVLEKSKSDLPKIISILKVLQKKQITYELLDITKIGKTITSLEKFESAKAEEQSEV